MNKPPLRFSISDLLLATLLAALPMAFKNWTGLLSAICLSLMSFALTFGFGAVALLLMCVSLVSAARLDTGPIVDRSPLGAFCTTVGLTIVTALVLRFFPTRKLW